MPARRPDPDVTVVTGAAGWFGTALLGALTAPGGPHARGGVIRPVVLTAAEATALSGDRPDERAAGAPTVEPVVADIRRPAAVEAVFEGLDGRVVDVVHAAGVIHPTDYNDFEAVNVRGTEHVLAAAARHHVRRVVHVSSNSPFGANPSPDDRFRRDEPYDPYLGYGRSKMQGELAVGRAVADGLDAVIVRPPWFYGPHQPARQTRFFTMVRTGRFPVIGDGEQRRSMTYVDNLVQGVVLAELVDTPAGSAWWIADAEPYSVNEIVRTVGEQLRLAGYEVKPNRLRIPAAAGRLAARADAWLQARRRYVTGLHVLGEMGLTIACDISAARRELGYDPQVDLAEGMRRSIAWCRDRGIDL